MRYTDKEVVTRCRLLLLNRPWIRFRWWQGGGRAYAIVGFKSIPFLLKKNKYIWKKRRREAVTWVTQGSKIAWGWKPNWRWCETLYDRIYGTVCHLYGTGGIPRTRVERIYTDVGTLIWCME